MAGTQLGGMKARETNLKRYGKDFYKTIGAIGGKAIGPKGFALNLELAKEAGRKGGLKSKRGPADKRFNITNSIPVSTPHAGYIADVIQQGLSTEDVLKQYPCITVSYLKSMVANSTRTFTYGDNTYKIERVK